MYDSYLIKLWRQAHSLSTRQVLFKFKTDGQICSHFSDISASDTDLDTGQQHEKQQRHNLCFVEKNVTQSWEFSWEKFLHRLSLNKFSLLFVRVVQDESFISCDVRNIVGNWLLGRSCSRSHQSINCQMKLWLNMIILRWCWLWWRWCNWWWRWWWW